ncbi:MAG: glycosyltransferase family 4 protein [Parvibaculum sp.]|nr:glycosyltransferase family 4 protein [Parvibaculum sp.]
MMATAALAFAATFLVRRYTQSIDIPNQRSSHDTPTPRGGGLAIVIVFYGSLLIACVLGYVESNLLVALGAGLVVAGAGYADDHKTLSARARLAFHCVAAFLAVGWLDAWTTLDLGVTNLYWGIVGSLVACAGLIWLTNLFNFMDGIDGIAACEAIFVSLAFALLGASPLVCVLLAAGALGFLCLNWPPARIFMGDVGSGFLGFIIGVLALHAITTVSVSPWPLLIVVGLFVTDASLTLAHRALRGEKVWLAHRTHAYQWAARRFGSHRAVLLSSIIINVAWLLPCAIAAYVFPRWAVVWTLVAYMPLIILAWYFHAGLAEGKHV